MDGLRWLLLFFGLLVVVGVYLYSRRDTTPKEDTHSFDRRAPTLDDGATDVDGKGEFDDALEPDDSVNDGETKSDNNGAPVEQKIVTLRLVAPNRGSFKGDELILSMRGLGLRRGQFGIFHRYDSDENSPVIFSAASLVEPGHFDIENIAEQTFPGISLFLVLPGPIDGVDAFDLMMTAARTLTQSLDGELLDESGSTLSIQRERYMREEVVQFEHSHKVA
jgi:cell division protein ZipA